MPSQLDLVKDQAERKQKQLSERFEKAQTFVEGEREQLQQLQQYQQEYLDTINQRQTNLTADSCSRYRQFCQQISEAIEGQQRKLAESERRLSEMRLELHQEQQRIQVLDEMIEREQQEQAYFQNQKLQKELDDHSSRRLFYS